MKLTITPLWTDDDGLMHVRVTVSGRGRESWGEAYCYPETISEFGSALTNFPQSTAHEVKLELGSSEPSYAEHVVVRAFIYDGAGHCAVEFRSENRGDLLSSASSRFALETEAASLNEMGRRVVIWALKPTEAFFFEGAGA